MREPTLSPVDVIAIGLIMKYGKTKLNYTETAQALNRCKDYIGAHLHEHGVTVERLGTKKGSPKLVCVYDIARLAADKSENVAAIRND